MNSNDAITSTESLVSCPACGLPAEIVDRFTLYGVPHSVELVKIICIARHWFTIPTDTLPVGDSAKARAESDTTVSR
jgi:hypothetical protein